MFVSLETIPADEIARRHSALRRNLAALVPDAGGLLVFSRLNIYYLTGTFGNGALWIPLVGQPVYAARRGLDRARLESPIERLTTFRSYKDLPSAFAEAGSPLMAKIAVEMNGLSWALGQSLAERLSGYELLSGDKPLSRTRSVKTAWELAKLRIAGARHSECLQELLPGVIVPGMSERQISHRIWDAFYSRGHSGMLRMENYGEEIFLGHVAAGESANYPSVFNGPVGLRGEHPSIPHMGYAGTIWKKNEPLVCDVGFALEGYQSDKTQVYWSGKTSSIPDQAKAAHDFCIAIQQYIAESLKPGAIPSQLSDHCFKWAVKEGWTDGFMALGNNKVRFIGHGIGLAIDEHPVIAKGFDDPLQSGMVMAIEPKIGIPGLGMVGVENTFEVTDNGGRCLTGNDYSIICIE